MEEEYARPTMKRDRSVLLHWYYFPDSHDIWTNVELPVDPPDSPAPHTGAWRVSKQLNYSRGVITTGTIPRNNLSYSG